MIKILNKIPKTPFFVACSGGIDSMAVLAFLMKGGYDLSVLFFHHNNEMADKEQDFVSNFCKKHGLNYYCGEVTKKKTNESIEEYWRNERYNFFNQYSLPIVTGHHLNDVIETWIFSSLNGQSKLIPYQRNNVIRPFLLNEKLELEKFVIKNNIPFIYDDSNSDLNRMRNLIRKEIVPKALMVNAGIGKMLKKRIIEKMSIF